MTTAAEDFPYNLADRWSLWAEMCLEIERLRAEVDRLEFDIGEHQAHMTCTPDRREP